MLHTSQSREVKRKLLLWLLLRVSVVLPAIPLVINLNLGYKPAPHTPFPSPKFSGRAPTDHKPYANASLKDLATSNASVPGIPHNDLTACRINGTEPDNGPFCSPIHSQNLWTGYTYGGKWKNTRQDRRSLWFPVTWNPTLFPDNATTTVELTYITADQQLAWSSPSVPNIRGFVNVYMDKNWLLGASGNDTTLGMFI